jgi:hypothetical protein
MPRTDTDGLHWQDEIPLLEQLCDFQGRPGGIAGLTYAYVPLDAIMDMTTAEAPTHHPYTSQPLLDEDRPLWKWASASSETIRITNTTNGKFVDFQILKRGKPLHGSCPGWYRCRAVVHPGIPAKLGWQGNEARRMLGIKTLTDEPQTTHKSVSSSPTTQSQASR